jgi:hypothetical protein
MLSKEQHASKVAELQSKPWVRKPVVSLQGQKYTWVKDLKKDL